MRLRDYWLLIPIETALVLAAEIAWKQQTTAWRLWSAWLLKQPVPDGSNILGVSTGVLQEPFWPIIWVAVCGGLVVLVLTFPMMWYKRVQKMHVNHCPICSTKLVYRKVATDIVGLRVRIERVCPRCESYTNANLARVLPKGE